VKGILIKFRVIISLGLVNVLRFIWYKASIKFGINPVTKISASVTGGDFFTEIEQVRADLPYNSQWLKSHVYFSWYFVSNCQCPDWFMNPFTGQVFKGVDKHWTKISDFDNNIGDIKTIWDPSRFDWVISFAQSASLGNKRDLKRLNDWLNDWLEKNPPYLGPNWKCGQEASIRVIHVATAALILKQYAKPSKQILSFIKAHLLRIYPTIQYAIAQNNNHGTSEAAALFVGGSWLKSQGEPDGEKFYKSGRKWLENRAKVLIETDGSFSQYSINYHRLMLDTYSIVEVWRRRLDLESFSLRLISQLSLASNWLFQFTNSSTGDTPNLGANDGARLIPLTDSNYRDFRPSVQLAKHLFCQEKAYEDDGVYDLSIKWLGIDGVKVLSSPVTSMQFDKGGYSILRNKEAFCVFKYPRYKYRPSQSDALHVDFWIGGKNILRDAGSFSYNASDEVALYYCGPEGHNTIQFDNHDQMPKLSRFLYGSWLKSYDVLFHSSRDLVIAQASYNDWRGAHCKRRVELSENCLKVTDVFSAVKEKAILRWRLIPSNWMLTENKLISQYGKISVTSDLEIKRIEIKDGIESRYYLQKTEAPVFEIEFSGAGKVVTEFRY